ncbi:MAG: ABC transporter ATP-binding protein [Candidatus Bathyarchaeia archaeon]|nr:ABC transporter ATP-binding protein [Candidatus Bathyarchaeota archaeon]
MARIYLDHLTKIFDGKVEAVVDLTMEIPDKSFISLLGPSGCGKTTTMRMIAGLETPTKGRVYFDDLDVTDMEKRDVAMVFQFPVLYPALTIFDNIAFPLKAKRVPKDEIKRRVKEVAELLKIEHILNKKPKDVDAGSRQMVSLAKCLVRRPKVYLLDEPLTNLDPKSRVEMRSELKRIQTELGQTMIYVTHDQTESMTLAEKIGVMNKGRLLQYDTPKRIYDDPANSFVAWFIGNPGMNLIDCTLSEEDGRAYLDSGVFRYDLTDLLEMVKERASSNELILGIRPEYVEVSSRKTPGWIMGKCLMIEPMGNRQNLMIEVDDKKIRAKVPLNVKVERGEPLWFTFPRKWIRIFDKKTTEKII